MDQIKRKLVFNQSSKEETKKLRNEFDRSITKIETLSNEFFYEIFDYLDGFEIYQAFSNLNHRFQQLLNSSCLLLKIQLGSSKYNDNYTQFLLDNKHKIISIRLRSGFEKNNFFSLFTIDSSLIRLESLFVDLDQFDLLISFIINLACLPRLFSLSIDPGSIDQNLNDIYRSVFVLPTLKIFRLMSYTNAYPISLPIPANKQLSTIEYLAMYHSCTFNELFTILAYTPQLRRLNLLDRIEIGTNIQTLLPITLSNLTDISMAMNHVKFDEFKILIRKINAKLKVLRVSAYGQDIAFLNAHQWENLILRTFPQLEEFYLRYHDEVGDEYEYPAYPQGPNQFSSSFWIERQWTFEAEIVGESIIFSIRPYRKRWYEYTQNKILNSSVEYSKSTRLKIKYIDTDDSEESLSIDTTRVLTIAQIYHLEIPEEKVHISPLIQAVNLLPELTTLKIHSLSLYEPRMLNSEELLILSSTEDTSKITKVYLEKMTEIGEFYFLLKLCPYMEYFRVDYIKHTDFKFVLRYIVKKLKDECNDYLHLLCFHIPTADDEMIKKFKRMIHFEKLLFNYTIKRVDDNIYLEWEL